MITKQRMTHSAGLTLLLAACCLAATRAEAASGTKVVTIRGQQQELHYLPAAGTSMHRTILYLPGVGGWMGWGISVAETMASWGYDVYGIDTKAYLDSFTSKTSTLHETDVMSDLRVIAEWASKESGQPVTLVGWSDGAALAVLGAAADDNKKAFAGLITFGLTDQNDISWHWSDNVTSLLKKPHERQFLVSEYMAKVSPLPMMMIQSSHDQYVSTDEAQRLFADAREPKRLELVQASNHRFDGNHDAFFQQLRDGLRWIGESK